MRLDALPILGSGMEGTVRDLGDGRVAKVWHRRTREDIEVSRGFGEALAQAGLPFGTPRVLDLLDHGGSVVTIEPYLSGRPATSADRAALVDVLAALAAVSPDPALASLPVLPHESAFGPALSFPDHLAALVRRRVASSREPLAARLPDLDDLVGATVASLEAFDVAGPCLVHGDLIPANVLLDDAGAVSAVLDFGFLTTVGDPAFDAAVTASIADMYGPDARATESALDDRVADRFQHDPERLATYRAAYALVTATCFSTSGSDGHFDWCVAMLERADVRAALSIASTRG